MVHPRRASRSSCCSCSAHEYMTIPERAGLICLAAIKFCRATCHLFVVRRRHVVQGQVFLGRSSRLDSPGPAFQHGPLGSERTRGIAPFLEACRSISRGLRAAREAAFWEWPVSGQWPFPVPGMQVKLQRLCRPIFFPSLPPLSFCLSGFSLFCFFLLCTLSSRLPLNQPKGPLSLGSTIIAVHLLGVPFAAQRPQERELLLLLLPKVVTKGLATHKIGGGGAAWGWVCWPFGKHWFMESLLLSLGSPVSPACHVTVAFARLNLYLTNSRFSHVFWNVTFPTGRHVRTRLAASTERFLARPTCPGRTSPGALGICTKLSAFTWADQARAELLCSPRLVCPICTDCLSEILLCCPMCTESFHQCVQKLFTIPVTTTWLCPICTGACHQCVQSFFTIICTESCYHLVVVPILYRICAPSSLCVRTPLYCI